ADKSAGRTQEFSDTPVGLDGRTRAAIEEPGPHRRLTPATEPTARQRLTAPMQTDPHELQVKVPAITLGFWLIKILATTLGETGGAAVSMSMNRGYLIATLLFMVLFVGAVIAQVAARTFHPFPYWATIICSTTVGTT